MLDYKILGFDFGLKFIGVAIGQTITKTATPLCSIRAENGIPDWDEITNLIQHWQPKALIVGEPVNMDDTVQHITFCARKFARRLENKYRLPVHSVDERLSTWEAKHQLKLQHENLDFKKIADINATAAALLVEQWLRVNAE